MRRAVAALILCVLPAVLSACGSPGEAALDPLRDELEAAGEVRLTATVSSPANGRWSEFTLDCVSSGGTAVLTVLAPDELAGVQAEINAGSGTLSYDGLELEFSEPGEVTPVTALPYLLDALAGAYVTLSWTEGEDTFVSLEATDSLSLTVRLDASGTPVWAELLVDGEAVIGCEITEFTID